MIPEDWAFKLIPAINMLDTQVLIWRARFQPMSLRVLVSLLSLNLSPYI